MEKKLKKIKLFVYDILAGEQRIIDIDDLKEYDQPYSYTKVKRRKESVNGQQDSPDSTKGKRRKRT